jgi:DNA-directed RNA polymerase subunit N (RpoN/RPB10)
VSDNWLTFIPADPCLVPSGSRRTAALRFLRSTLPKAAEIEAVLTEEIRFIDCGGNFEKIECPSCSALISDKWWSGAMDKADKKAFKDLNVKTPCCRKETSLNDLKYDWPQGFAKFSIKIMNPKVPDLAATDHAKLEGLLGCTLRRIWAHY